VYQQVPERFLEVAQITLREFFNAIVAGKDVDPSWKKAIYKVICKLDSEVPEIFKSPNCLQGSSVNNAVIAYDFSPPMLLSFLTFLIF